MQTAANGSEPFILFELAGATYALRSRDIQQLEMLTPITPVPNAPPFVDGLVSVRGQVIPVLNLRARFGFPRVDPTVRTRLLIVGSGGRTVGMVVDSAREFATIADDAIQPPPEGISELSGRYLAGMAQLNDRLVLVLDVAELLQTDDAAPTNTAPELA